jgi:hypothetical protein
MFRQRPETGQDAVNDDDDDDDDVELLVPTYLLAQLICMQLCSIQYFNYFNHAKDHGK